MLPGMLPGLTREEILRYSRHLLIPEVGLDGQRKLKGSSALVIGTGGLGSPVRKALSMRCCTKSRLSGCPKSRASLPSVLLSLDFACANRLLNCSCV